MAANRYRGDARLTTDLDMLVEPHLELAASLREAGYAVTEVADPGERPHLLIARSGHVRIDILPAVVPYQHVALARAQERFLSVEDVIVHKLIAWRPRDRDDIRSILETGRQVDRDYVRTWATEWDVLDRWTIVHTENSA